MSTRCLAFARRFLARTGGGASAVSLILTGLLLVGMGLVGTEPTQAQSRSGQSVPQEYRSGDQSPQQAKPPSSNLPDWAAPSSPPASQESGTGSIGGTGTNAKPPPPPDPPSRVPVDGGLGFLALAGAGYAVRKLRADEEDPSGGPA